MARIRAARVRASLVDAYTTLCTHLGDPVNIDQLVETARSQLSERFGCEPADEEFVAGINALQRSRDYARSADNPSVLFFNAPGGVRRADPVKAPSA
jgi:Rieske Fe-S protein